MTDEELVKLIKRIEAKQAEARKWRTKNGCEDIGFGTEDELLSALKYSLDRIEQLVATNEALVKEQNEWRQRAIDRGEETEKWFRKYGAEQERAERLEAALKWQAEQPEAHPFMVARARAALKGN